MKHQDKRERALIVAEQVKLLFGFCAQLIPDKDMLREVLSAAGDSSSRAMAMAPIIGAFGGDWESIQFEADLRSRRIEALFNLIDVLDQTEESRKVFIIQQKKKAEGRAQISKMLGVHED